MTSQCHRDAPNTPLAETMQALTEVVRQGKARFVGFSEWPADKIRAALAMAGVERFVSSQPQYSLLWRDPERAVFPLCAANGIGQIVWSPLAQGVLTSRYRPDAPLPEDSRPTRRWALISGASGSAGRCWRRCSGSACWPRRTASRGHNSRSPVPP